jgi:hypothetical protein
VSPNGKAAFGGVDADLVCASGERLGSHHLQPRISKFGIQNRDEFCLGDFSICTTRIFFTNAHERSLHRKFFRWHFAVGEQKVFFTDAVFRELLGERFVGGRRFAEDEDAAGFLVEPVQNGERRPARLAMFQPIVNAFARVRRRRVGVPAGGFGNHQQMFVFKNHARNHAQMKTVLTDQMKGGIATASIKQKNANAISGRSQNRG